MVAANGMNKFMTGKTLSTLFLAILFAGICVAESGYAQAVTHWGKSVSGVQLSIGLSNVVVRTGSTTIFYTRTKNSSTNVFRIIPKKSITPYILTDRSGKDYQVVPVIEIPTVIDANPPPNFYVSSGETNEWSVPVKFGNDIEPGTYVFKPITQDITSADGKVCTLTSNSLQVKVVR